MASEEEQDRWHFADPLEPAPTANPGPMDETAPIDPIWAADDLPESWRTADEGDSLRLSPGEVPAALPSGEELEAIPLTASTSSTTSDGGTDADIGEPFVGAASASSAGPATASDSPRSTTSTTTTADTARARNRVEASDASRDDPDAESPSNASGSGAGRRFPRLAKPSSIGGRSKIPGLTRIPDVRIVVAGLGALLILLALLASEAGIAILIASVLLPIAAVVALDRGDVFDREPPLIMLGISTSGALAGILIALLNGVILDEFWDRNAVDRIGAVGFAGELVGRTESPPLAIYALAGVVVPALAIAAMLAAPIAARRWTSFRNEAMDGVLLGAAAGAGFAFGTALVHLWPLITGDRIVGSVADWTAAVLSIAVFRSITLMSIAALTALAIWQFDLSRVTQDMVVPLATGFGGAIAYTSIGLLTEQSGATAQFLFNVVLAAVLLAAARLCLQRGIDFDRSQLAGGRVVCPTCRQITPAGKFCAFCKAPLTSETGPKPAL